MFARLKLAKDHHVRGRSLVLQMVELIRLRQRALFKMLP